MLSCFFPTTVVLIDDNVGFLNSLEESMMSLIPGITIIKFSNQLEALKYVNESAAWNRLNYADLTKGSEESTSDWKCIALNINYLHQEIYNGDRFSIISTVVVDHAMPGTNGVEICASISDSNIQKILLTGNAEDKVAIDAFNNGEINRYIRKGRNTFVEGIKEGIIKSIYQFFKNHANDIFKHLSVYDKTHLQDPVFSNFFSGICSKKDYIEYYMLDVFGGYLFLSSSGEPSLLSVLTEYEMSRIIEIGKESGEISTEALKGLESREYMLVSHNCSGQLPPINEWEYYIRPASKLEGYQIYYFTFAGAESLDLDFDSIKSFDKFRKHPSGNLY
ncbi:MAG: hypothetical protein LBB25_04000 [Holosporaceae bacterium]|nr:hypothetical protein [Holosporaceae bacterium]